MTTDTHIKSPQTTYPIHDLIADRWSPRAFADKDVPQEVIGSLLEAARWSASSGNKQPWSFIVATRDDTATFEKIYSILMEGNQVWAKNAPVLMLAIAHDAHEKPHTLLDLGLALQSLTVEATSRDIYLHQMGGIYGKKAAEIFNVPATHKVAVGLALGYLGDPDTLTDRYRERELAPRQRKPLSEFVFSGEWGTVASVAEGK